MADDDGAGRKVGEVAEATGLTVRTLHHYEQIGLLGASGRTASGHRLYAPADIERLYRICLLRRLGLPLGDIGSVLDDPSWDLHAAVCRHRAELERRMAAEARLRTPKPRCRQRPELPRRGWTLPAEASCARRLGRAPPPGASGAAARPTARGRG